MSSNANAPTGFPRDIPTLCLDTCSVLDILHDPRARNVRENHHTAAVALLRTAEAGDLEMVAADLVRTEYANNVAAVEQQTADAVEHLLADIRKIDAIVNTHGGAGTTDARHWRGHASRCRLVADRWMQIASRARDSDAVLARGARRVGEGRAPSRKGNEAAKDCFIVETYLEHIRDVRAQGLTAPVVFVSSNVKDYAERSGTRLAADLRAEFAAVRMRYAPNMAAAKAFLDL